MAPETYQGANVTQKVDTFAFAIVLYEVITGIAPHIASQMKLPQYAAAVALHRCVIDLQMFRLLLLLFFVMEKLKTLLEM